MEQGFDAVDFAFWKLVLFKFLANELRSCG